MSDIDALRAAMEACGIKTKHRHAPIEYSWDAESQPANHELDPPELFAAAEAWLLEHRASKSQDRHGKLRHVWWLAEVGDELKRIADVDDVDNNSVDIRAATQALEWAAKQKGEDHDRR